MAKRIKQQANVAPVPKDLTEARKFMRLIGEHQRDAARIEHDLNDQVGALREKYAVLAAPHNKQVEERIEGLRIWAEARRDELTKGGRKKTVDLGTGELGWRTTPPKISCARVVAIITELRNRKLLKKFSRPQIEVNKEAILNECAKTDDGKWDLPDSLKSIPGLSVKAVEEFFVVPAEDELGEAA